MTNQTKPAGNPLDSLWQHFDHCIAMQKMAQGQESQYAKLVIAMKQDLGGSESPNQYGILHRLGVLLVAKAKYLGDAQLIHQATQYPFSLYLL